MARPKPVLLLILDGWGHRDEPAHNPIAIANAPNWRRLLADYPHTLVETHGRHVGLPDDQMGNSEVGHMNIGSGRVVYQDLTRIDAAIADRTFFDNPALLSACDAAKRNGSTLHVFGLVSPGGVHSHEDHILAMLDLAAQRGVASIVVHAFLDGRDTPPRSAPASLRKLEEKCASLPGAHVASVSGRYFAMDRDKRWDRVKLAYDAIANADSPLHASSAVEALELAYARGENDEFVKPTVIGNYDGTGTIVMGNNVELTDANSPPSKFDQGFWEMSEIAGDAECPVLSPGLMDALPVLRDLTLAALGIGSTATVSAALTDTGLGLFPISAASAARAASRRSTYWPPAATARIAVRSSVDRLCFRT